MRMARVVPVAMAAVPASAVVLAPAAADMDWTHFARSPARSAVMAAMPPALGPPRWVLAEVGGSAIVFNGQFGVVASGGIACATGRHQSQHVVVAARVSDGEVLWMRPVPSIHLDSWSTPAIDGRNGTVIVASGAFVTALDLLNGAERWQAALSRPVVNASPLVTDDLAPANRAFITDYDGFGGSGRLYCINVDPFDAAANPHQPGAVVWSVVLGDTSGNSPAYADGVVYIAAVGNGSDDGLVYAFDAAAMTPPEPLWVFVNPLPRGFFGGVAVHESGQDRFIYSASYSLYGGQFAANLVKIRGADGTLVWSTPSNRTSSLPIVLGDGRIVLSSGIRGYGSTPSIQLFQDDGTSAAMLWDSAVDTWVDSNQNGIMDPGEYLLLGGWTHQPIAYTHRGGNRLVSGAIQAQTFAACNDLYIIDLDRHPSDPAFVVSHTQGAGSTPAAVGPQLLTLGPGGLHAFGPGCYANCDNSAVPPILNVDDFTCFINRFAAGSLLPHAQQVEHAANCDGSTTFPALNVDDFTCFINRYSEGCS
jgi:outer membrane protein assembly factor BamB